MQSSQITETRFWFHAALLKRTTRPSRAWATRKSKCCTKFESTGVVSTLSNGAPLIMNCAQMMRNNTTLTCRFVHFSQVLAVCDAGRIWCCCPNDQLTKVTRSEEHTSELQSIM